MLSRENRTTCLGSCPVITPDCMHTCHLPSTSVPSLSNEVKNSAFTLLIVSFLACQAASSGCAQSFLVAAIMVVIIIIICDRGTQGACRGGLISDEQESEDR